MHGSPGFDLLHKAGMAVHACNLSTREKEAGGPGLLGHPKLHSKFKFKDSLRYRRPRVEEEEKEQEEAQ